MDIKEIQSLIKFVAKSGASEVKLETDDIKIEVEIVDDEPWEGYTGLNAQEILDRLEHLDVEQLEELRDFEANTKNRVTVLREIDMLLAGLEMSSPADMAEASAETGEESDIDEA